MKAKEIRDLSTEEIKSQIAEEREQLNTLQFQHAIADLQNPMILRDKRRFIARLETILKERQLAEETA
ncbi:MAG: 50S ribosomal protein L29 [Rhodothermales bacterium]|jgi:large subunit ribosomal protein L29